MKKNLLVLLLAVLLPSLFLGWLALRGAREQQIILERRTAELCQQDTDNVATTARSLISEQRRMFAETLRQLLAGEADPRGLAARFTTLLRDHWPQPAVGFALDDSGRFLSPTSHDAGTDPQIRRFLHENGDFLGNKTAATAYPVTMNELNRPELAQRNRTAYAPPYNLKQTPDLADAAAQNGLVRKSAQAESNAAPASVKVRPPALDKESSVSKDNNGIPSQPRNVVPQQQNAPAESQVYGANAEFRQFTADESEGVVNRYVQDRLNMIFWVRPAAARDLVFGCLLHGEDLRDRWADLFETIPARGGRGRADDAADTDFILALLDDKGQPVAVSPADSPAQDWKKPFAASEIGEALPHWEAVLYLRHPEHLQASAQRVRRNLYLLIFCALAAIAAGGWVVFADTRRQLALAQKKTDFVSNVSHELKTPLTSIRMFAELMHDGRAAPERQGQYLRIIMVESERLTRLINNVLDFSRLDRRERRFQMRPVDLHETLTQLWPAQEFRLREAGFTTHWESAPPTYPIMGDEDALAQVLVNLLSNAEKYGGERKEITLHSFLEDAWVCLSVLDRGPGVPPGEEGKIFEPFYRAHDSLSSGIPGTGLGLALARRVVREHGGEILYQTRPGGGSNFTVRLPLARVVS